MIRIFKTAVWFHFLALFSLILSFYSANAFVAGTNSRYGQSNDEESHFSLTFFDLFCSTVQNEKTVKDYSQLTSTAPKNHFNDLVTGEKSAELFLVNKISKYIFKSDLLFISFPRIVIIFPFHYFW